MLLILTWLQDLHKGPHMDHNLAKVYVCLVFLPDFHNNFKEFQLRWLNL